MPKHTKNQKRIFNNINKYEYDNEMQTDDNSDDDFNYNPMQESKLDDTAVDEEILVETIDLVMNDASLRNISVFAYALLKKFGINTAVIRNFFPTIGLQCEQNCRENLIKIHNSNYEELRGGKLKLLIFYK